MTPEMIAKQLSDAAQRVVEASDKMYLAVELMQTTLVEHRMMMLEIMREHARALADKDHNLM